LNQLKLIIHFLSFCTGNVISSIKFDSKIEFSFFETIAVTNQLPVLLADFAAKIIAHVFQIDHQIIRVCHSLFLKVSNLREGMNNFFKSILFIIFFFIFIVYKFQ